MGVVIFQHLTG